jgi:hypothetical protein
MPRTCRTGRVAAPLLLLLAACRGQASRRRPFNHDVFLQFTQQPCPSVPDHFGNPRGHGSGSVSSDGGPDSAPCWGIAAADGTWVQPAPAQLALVDGPSGAMEWVRIPYSSVVPAQDVDSPGCPCGRRASGTSTTVGARCDSSGPTALAPASWVATASVVTSAGSTAAIQDSFSLGCANFTVARRVVIGTVVEGETVTAFSSRFALYEASRPPILQRQIFIPAIWFVRLHNVQRAAAKADADAVTFWYLPESGVLSPATNRARRAVPVPSRRRAQDLTLCRSFSLRTTSAQVPQQ